MNKRFVPKAERSIFYRYVEALRADDPPLGVEPAADNNVMRITEHCLFMRTASGSLYGGRGSMSWWATVMLYMMLTLFAVLAYPGFSYAKATGFQGNYVAYWLTHAYGFVGIPVFVFLCCFWMFIPWRRQLPIILNRRTQTITCVIQGKLMSCEWKQIEAYIKDVMVIGSNAHRYEGLLTFVFPGYGDPRLPRAAIKATEDTLAAIVHGGAYGAAMLWEYLRLYMQEGMDAVPAPAPKDPYLGKSVRDCIQHLNPWMLFTYRVWWKVLIIILLSPLLIPFLTCMMLGDITYTLLDRILPQRKWPQALIDACEGVWDGNA